MFPANTSQPVAILCALAPVIPEITIDHISSAKPLARALVLGGLPVFEVSSRAPAALEIIAEMAEVPGTQIGAGPIVHPSDAHAVKAAGASFGVSAIPSAKLQSACELINLALLPTATREDDARHLNVRGFSVQRFAPAVTATSLNEMKKLGVSTPLIRFIPTGVASLELAREFLSVSNTLCVSGNWVAPHKLIIGKTWDKITELAKKAAILPR